MTPSFSAGATRYLASDASSYVTGEDWWRTAA